MDAIKVYVRILEVTIIAFGVILMLAAIPMVWMPLIGVPLIVLGALTTYCGIALWKKKSWARPVARDICLGLFILLLISSLNVFVMIESIWDYIIILIFFALLLLCLSGSIVLTWNKKVREFLAKGE